MTFILAVAGGILLGVVLSRPLIRLIGHMLGLHSKDAYRFLNKN